MKNRFLNIFHKTVNFLWEFPCPVCLRDNSLPHDYNGFCGECLDAIPLFHGKRCPGCGAELDGVLEQCNMCLSMPPRPWKNAMSVMKMEGVGEKVIYALKFSGNTAIARALALSPDILCFDEPTSALDPELTGEVLKVIKGLIDEDRTIIIVTHEMDFAKNVSDKIIFMADGIIEEIGTPDEVFNAPKSEKTKAFFRSDTL